MSKSAEILSEYLVKIGFVDDEEGRKSTQKNIEKLETALGKLAKRTVIAGASFAGMAVAMSNKLGSVEQQARRLNTSAGSLRVFAQGFKSLGLSADAAQGHIASLYELLNGNGGKAWEKAIKDAFKVDVRDADGALRDLSKIYTDIIKAVQGGGDIERARLQQWLHFDLDTANSALDGTLLASIEKAEKRQQELAPTYNEQARQAEALHKELDELGNTFTLLGQNLASQLTPSAIRILKVVKDSSEVLAELLNNVLTPIGNFLAQFAESAQKKVQDSGATTAGGKTWAFFMPQGIIDQAEKQPAKPSLSAKPLFKGERNNNPGNIRKGDAFRTFSTPQEGLEAMAYLLGKYRNSGLTTIRSIISKWAPDSENKTAAYIADVMQQMSVGADDWIDLRDPATIQKLMKAMIRHENGRNIYGDDMIRQAVPRAVNETGKLGTWTFKPSTTVTVNIIGASDPQAVADAVGSKVKGVISDSDAQLRAELGRYSAPLSFAGTD